VTGLLGYCSGGVDALACLGEWHAGDPLCKVSVWAVCERERVYIHTYCLGEWHAGDAFVRGELVGCVCVRTCVYTYILLG
jgi:hypothetical protein